MTAPICLLTRPEAQSRAMAAELPGVAVLISPILRIVGLDFDRDRLAGAAGLVFTSANALPFAGPGKGRAALCVGPQTASAARQAGFDVTEGPGDAEGLLPLLKTRRDWLHLHGRHRAKVLPIAGIAVYDQQPQPLNEAAQAALTGETALILPLFSPRSAALLSAALTGATAPVTVIAISDAANAQYSGPAISRHIAARPDRKAMVHAILSQYDLERRRLPWVETERGGR